MTRQEQIAAGLGLLVGTAATVIALIKFHAQREIITDLKVDNINLLNNTAKILNCVDAGEPIPNDVLVDVRFRCMAFMVEYEDEDDNDAQ